MSGPPSGDKKCEFSDRQNDKDDEAEVDDGKVDEEDLENPNVQAINVLRLG